MKLTIHRALAELKLIDKKVESAINEIRPSGVMQKNQLVNGIAKLEDFEKDARAKYQSINDFLTRKAKIKASIVESNVKTFVEIAEKSMSVADAINQKGLNNPKKELIRVLKQRHKVSKSDLEKHNAAVDKSALKLAEVALSKEGVKIEDNDAAKVIDPYLDNNKFSLVDPLDADKLVQKLQSEIDEFESEVDAVLSESNAITTIDI